VEAEISHGPWSDRTEAWDRKLHQKFLQSVRKLVVQPIPVLLLRWCQLVTCFAFQHNSIVTGRRKPKNSSVRLRRKRLRLTPHGNSKMVFSTMADSVEVNWERFPDLRPTPSFLPPQPRPRAERLKHLQLRSASILWVSFLLANFPFSTVMFSPLDKERGRAFLSENGDLVYSPNSLRVVEVPPPFEGGNDPFRPPCSSGNRNFWDLDVEAYKKPTWWSDYHGWVSFLQMQDIEFDSSILFSCLKFPASHYVSETSDECQRKT
jgi:hypothetical protein